MATFQYQPLSTNDTIRILWLQPGSEDDAIKCEIKQIRLSEAEGHYEAISYVWGDETTTADIICDSKAFRATANLYAALRRFRRKSETRMVWIDAICINQKDVAERNAQVAQMGGVYRTANRVLCWLGEDDEGIAGSCFALIHQARQFRKDQWREESTLSDLIYDLGIHGIAKGEEWDKLGRLLDLPWFKRMWVVQESALARECGLFWGNHELELYEVIEVAGWLAYSMHATALLTSTTGIKLVCDVFADITCTYRNKPTWRDKTPSSRLVQRLQPPEKQRWIDLLYCARSLQATDQRDLIYSSLGNPLAHYSNGEVMVPPDYNESLPLLQTRTARTMLRCPREAPYVLTLVCHDSKEDIEADGVPTWVPRWTSFNERSARPVPLTCSYEHRQKPYCATRGSFECTFLSKSVLSTTGYLFDTLTWVSSPLESADFKRDKDIWRLHYRETKTSPIESLWIQLLKQWSRSPDELFGLLSMTLARGRPKSEDHMNDFSAYCEVCRQIAGTESVSPFIVSVSGEGDPSTAEWTIARARDRCIALTAGGRMALVPLVANVGDACHLVQGVHVPLLLRASSSGTYQCMGDMYCSGVMEGEFLEANTTPRPTWQEVRLH